MFPLGWDVSGWVACFRLGGMFPLGFGVSAWVSLNWLSIRLSQLFYTTGSRSKGLSLVAVAVVVVIYLFI